MNEPSRLREHEEDPRYEPERVDASRDTGLHIVWADGHESTWPLDEVRRRCPCAHCNDRRRKGEPVWPPPGTDDSIDAVDATLKGSYGISFFWSDGHQTGIYQWRELRNDCECPSCKPSTDPAAT